VESNLIDGCQSRVWLQADLVEMRNEKGEMSNVIHFQAESDALIVKGIVALLIRVMNGRTAEEAAGIDLYFIDAIGLGENLSPTRSNGLRAMIAQMKLYALVFSKQS
jgi:cysteine desulfuration protein SufE